MIQGLIGMVHLGPLPGAARSVPLDEVIDRAVSDAVDLVDAGFDALMIENFGDAPFFADDVPKVTIAAMTRAIAAIATQIEVPFGVNVLRNDGLGALAVAAATGAQFIRINVLLGSMSTDPGPIIAVRLDDEARAFAFWKRLIEQGVYTNLAIPPGTPNGISMLRCSVSAAHSEAQIEKIIAAFVTVAAELMN